jgi:hypothetical protein
VEKMKWNDHMRQQRNGGRLEMLIFTLIAGACKVAWDEYHKPVKYDRVNFAQAYKERIERERMERNRAAQ